MKRLNTVLLLALLLLWGSKASAQNALDGSPVEPPVTQSDGSDDEDSWEGDSLIRPLTGQLLTSKIQLLTRTYGDRVALRWLPEDYVSWLFLCHSGVNVLREDSATHEVVRLAEKLKPLTQKQFETKYPETDSLAMIAMGTLYGEGRLGENQTREKPGSQGANVELNNEQDLSFAYAMLVAEWRPDLAEAMAVGFTDRTAQRGHVYHYYVQPSNPDFKGKIIFEPGIQERVKNEPYKPLPYDPKPQYEQVSPRRVALSWVDTHHSSFEVERREGKGAWQRLNDNPYLSMIQETETEGLNIFSDSVPHFGTWEYRILGHDAFGQLDGPSPVLTAYIGDIEPPRAPQLKQIVIERPDDNDLSSRVLAHLFWQVSDSLEADLQGYLPHYYNEQVTGHRWMPLGDQLISPTDTTCVVDVTGLRTGMLCIMAYDNSGNTGQSLAQMIRITDYKAPSAPDSLRAIVLPAGQVILSWRPKPEDRDIAYYDLAFANDSTHTFLNVNQGGILDPMYVDSLALDINQKYIYYKVRAVDYESNFGDWSPILQVRRPHDTPPTTPHLDRSSHDDQTGMHMRWIVGTDADMEYHLLQRRIGDDGEWQVLGRYDADSIARTGHYEINIDDNPAYNREQRYYYRVESFNSSSYTSQSLAVSWLHQGPKYFDIPITLVGAWIEKEHKVRLTWEVGELPIKDVPYYFCVFRKGPNDKQFKYVVNVTPEDGEFTDYQPKPGTEVQYYVSIRFEDGRESRESNTVTLDIKK